MVAVLIGGTTGFIGGRLDLVTQRFVDAWMAFPGLLLLLTIMSIAGRGMLQIIIVLGVSGGIPASRVVRGAVLGVKENAYFQAAQAIGSSRRRSLLRHVLPNIAAPIIIIFSINVGGVIMAEAALSFLGFGLPADVPSWGGMLSREGRRYMEVAPHLALWPGVCLTVVVYTASTCSATRCATCWTPACAAASAATAPAGSSGVSFRLIAVDCSGGFTGTDGRRYNGISERTHDRRQRTPRSSDPAGDLGNPARDLRRAAGDCAPHAGDRPPDAGDRPAVAGD